MNTPVLVLDHRCLLAEGPGWDERAQRLLFVDILRGVVHRFDPVDGNLESLEIGDSVGAVAPREVGGWVLAVRNGFAVLDSASARVRVLAHVDEGLPGGRMNDGKCDPAGRFWAGTQSDDPDAGLCGLYRLDPDGSVRRMLAGVGISNGLDWSQDASTMYYVDSATGGIDAFSFDLAAGNISERRRVVDVPAELGLADGIALDAEGGLWVALFRGSAVHRYSADGALEAVIDVPASLVTSCAFGGADLGDLYITTAAHRLQQPEPNAGALFCVRPGVHGCPVRRFAA